MSVGEQIQRKKSPLQRRMNKGIALFLSLLLCFGTLPAWADEVVSFEDFDLQTDNSESTDNNDESLECKDDGFSKADLIAEDLNGFVENRGEDSKSQNLVSRLEADTINDNAISLGSADSSLMIASSESLGTLDEGDPDFSGTITRSGATTNWKYYASNGTLTLEGETVNFTFTTVKSQLPGVVAGDIKHVELIGDVKTLGSFAFMGLTSLEKIEIPESVTALSTQVFSGCTGLREVNIPSGITVIPSSAFVNCSSLEKVDLPEGITKIDTTAFSGCGALTSIGIDDCTQLSTMGNSAFRNCSSLSSIDLSNTALTALPSGAFQSCGVTDLKLPKGLTTLGDQALNGTDNLAYVVIPSGVTSLGNSSLQLFGWKTVDEENDIYPTVVLPYSIETIDSNFHPGSTPINIIVCGAPSTESINDAVEDVKDRAYKITYQLHHDASTDPYEVTSEDSKISFTCDTCGDEVAYSVDDYAPIAIDGQEAQAFKTAVGASGSLLSGYKISLKDADNNAVTTLDNKLKITLPVSDAQVGENLQIYRMNDDGTAALLGAAPVTEAGLATFETDTASGTFAVVRTTELTLTFDTVGGTSVDAESVTYNATPSKPATDPTRDGYTFTGWFSDAACTTAFDFTKPLTANTTVYAGWTAVKAEAVSLTFDVQGGSAEAAQTLDSGATPTKPTDPTRDGYTFTGWFSDSACTTAFDFTKPLTADTTVYAGWKANDASDDNTGNTNAGTPNSTTGNPTSVAAKSSSSTSPVASASTIAKTGDDLMPLGVLLASTSLIAALAAGVALRRKQNLS